MITLVTLCKRYKGAAAVKTNLSDLLPAADSLTPSSYRSTVFGLGTCLLGCPQPVTGGTNTDPFLWDMGLL